MPPTSSPDSPTGCAPAQQQHAIALYQARSTSDDLAVLVAVRIGLCDLMRRGLLDPGRAALLFEQERDRVSSSLFRR